MINLIGRLQLVSCIVIVSLVLCYACSVKAATYIIDPTVVGVTNTTGNGLIGTGVLLVGRWSTTGSDENISWIKYDIPALPTETITSVTIDIGPIDNYSSPYNAGINLIYVEDDSWTSQTINNTWPVSGNNVLNRASSDNASTPVGVVTSDITSWLSLSGEGRGKTLSICAQRTGGGARGSYMAPPTPKITITTRAWQLPTTPKNLKANLTNMQAILTWDASIVGESALAGYDIYKKIDNGSYAKINTTLVTQTTYKDTKIEKGKTYSYYVKAVDSAGYESNTSNISTITVSAGTTILEPNQSGELKASNDPYTKLIIPADVIKRKLQYTLEVAYETLNSSIPDQQIITVYNIEAKDVNTGEVIRLLEGGVTIVLHWTISGEFLSGTNISSKDISSKLGVGYWSSKYWVPLSSRVEINNNDIFVTTNVAHLSKYGMILKEKTVSLNVSPNPFTPLGPDSRFRQVNFTFENTDGEEVELKIWDVTGRLVREIRAYGVSTVSWDGKDEYGEVCEGGAYIYQLKVGNKIAGRGTVVLAK